MSGPCDLALLRHWARETGLALYQQTGHESRVPVYKLQHGRNGICGHSMGILDSNFVVVPKTAYIPRICTNCQCEPEI